MREIYLDNSATTKVCSEAAQAAVRVMTEHYGNPSSLHSKGLEAEHELEDARRIISGAIGVTPDEIIFTSGGTEANNMAVSGAARALSRRGKRIVTSAVEHSSVIAAMKELEKDGFEVIYLRPDKTGRLDPQEISDAVTKDTILVSIMAVNNETGAIQPIDEVKKALRCTASPALFHVDAVQAFMKHPVPVKSLGIDLMTVSGHKIHAPKGVGALYIRKGVRILPLHYGGEQEKRLRPGTEALPLIAAMGAAISADRGMNEKYEIVKVLNEYCRTQLSGIDGVVINSDKGCLPYILNISIPGIRSETMLHFLEEDGIYVSSGSACAKGQKSHVLTAMGLDDNYIDSALRVSFSEENSMEDADIFINTLKRGLSALARKR